MDKREIIERLKNIAKHAVHTAGEKPFVMSLDDGIALKEAIELLKKPETSCSEIPKESDTISRRAAIAIVLEYDRRLCEHIGTPEDNERYAFGRGLLLNIERNLKQLASVQPDVPDRNVGNKERGMNNEIYRLALDHFISNDGEHTRLEEPLVVQMIYDRRYTPSAICLNSMIDRMRAEILRRATKGAQE